MIDVVEIIGLVLLGILGLFTLVSALIGLGRGLKKTLGTTVVIILSVLIALLLTVLVLKPLILNSNVITEKLAELMEDAAITDILDMSTVTEALSYYVYMLAAPFAFVMIFVVVRFILGIVMKFVIKRIPILNKIPKVAKRLGGLGVGLVNGFILCIIFFMPLLGTVNVFNNVVSNIELPEFDAEESVESGYVELLSSKESSETEVITDVISPIVEEGAGNVILSCGGELMYDMLASANYYGERVTLSGEATVIVNMANEFSSAEDDDDFIVVAVDAVVGAIEKSAIIKNLAAEIVSEVAKAWIDEEAFMGMEKISAGEMLDPTIDAVIEVLATESREYIYEDLKSFSDFIHVAYDYEMLSANGDGESMIDVFGENGMFVDLISTLEDNDRMVPVVDEVNAFAVRIFTLNLGTASDHNELYDSLMKSLGGTVNQYSSRMISRYDAKEAIIDAFQSHGIVLEGEEVDNVADALLNEYHVVYEDMPERLSEFFTVYLGTKSGSLIENGDGSLSMGSTTLKYYFAYNYKNSQAYELAATGKSIGKAETLFSAASMETVVVTADELFAQLVSYEDIKDRHSETQKIDAVIVSLVDAYKNMDESEMDVSNVMAEMGAVLDQMNKTSVYGDLTSDFLVSIMQSEDIAASLGLNLIEMTDIAYSINDGHVDGADYAQITTTVSQSISMLDKVNGGEASQEVIQDLMKDLTPSTAKVMQNITTPSLMLTYGVGEDNAEKSSSAVSSLFGNMADYTNNHPQGNMSDEEYKASIERESQAVEKIVAISIKATEDKDEAESLFTTEGEDGALDMSAYDVVDLFATSAVAGDTVNDLVNGDGESEGGFDPLGIETNMTDSDRTELSVALDEYKANNSHVEGIDESLANIGAMFGIIYGSN